MKEQILEIIANAIEKENRKIEEAKQNIEKSLDNIAGYETIKQFIINQYSENQPVSQLAKLQAKYNESKKETVYDFHRNTFRSLKQKLENIKSMKNVDLPEPTADSNRYCIPTGGSYLIGVSETLGAKNSQNNVLCLFVEIREKQVKTYENYKAKKSVFKKNIDKLIDFKEKDRSGRKIEVKYQFDPDDEKSKDEILTMIAQKLAKLRELCKKYE